MPIAQAPPEATPARWVHPPASPGGPTLLLGANGAVPAEDELRWMSRFAMLCLGAVVLRWALR